MRVAINGYGRIGRNILRALYESNRQKDIQIVAINDLSDPATSVHLTQYDTAHGRFKETVSLQGGCLCIQGDKIKIIQQRDPTLLPWKDLNIDVVLECTGIFASREKAQKHLEAGARKVLVSAPAGNDMDATIVYGVNHTTLKASYTLVSNASCTTNCLAPLVKPLHEKLGIVSGLMTTIHSYTNDQVLTDIHHSDLRRARSATHSMIPTKTGAASAVGLVLPELKGKLDGLAIRVPTINVSLVDLSFIAARNTTVEEVTQILTEASQVAPLKGILTLSTLPLVSVDFNHNPASSIIDVSETKVIGNLVKVLSWYDNEWGFSNRMLDTAQAMMQAQ
jgi:glyceraldehyde 3-phosphate dehydrogenase